LLSANSAHGGQAIIVSDSGHNFWNFMSPTREDVVRMVQSTFPRENWHTVIETLDLYTSESVEQARARVQLAILKLCGGDEGKLLHYVAAAQQDYRDVLYWSEYPEMPK
jgi:hypothetical protein